MPSQARSCCERAHKRPPTTATGATPARRGEARPPNLARPRRPRPRAGSKKRRSQEQRRRGRLEHRGQAPFSEPGGQPQPRRFLDTRSCARPPRRCWASRHPLPEEAELRRLPALGFQTWLNLREEPPRARPLRHPIWLQPWNLPKARRSKKQCQGRAKQGHSA